MSINDISLEDAESLMAKLDNRIKILTKEKISRNKEYQKVVKEVFGIMEELDQTEGNTSESGKVRHRELKAMLDLKQKRARALDKLV